MLVLLPPVWTVVDPAAKGICEELFGTCIAIVYAQEQNYGSNGRSVPSNEE